MIFEDESEINTTCGLAQCLIRAIYYAKKTIRNKRLT